MPYSQENYLITQRGIPLGWVPPCATWESGFRKKKWITMKSRQGFRGLWYQVTNQSTWTGNTPDWWCIKHFFSVPNLKIPSYDAWSNVPVTGRLFSIVNACGLQIVLCYKWQSVIYWLGPCTKGCFMAPGWSCIKHIKQLPMFCTEKSGTHAILKYSLSCNCHWFSALLSKTTSNISNIKSFNVESLLTKSRMWHWFYW